jgi:hypothetical protein
MREATMTIDWNKAAVRLKRDVTEHGGFLTIKKDEIRERFDIGRLAEKNSEDLVDMLREHEMIVVPHPYDARTSLRIYDVESEIGKIAQAVFCPDAVPETALRDAVDRHEREEAGKDRRSDDVPWLSALDVFLQLVIGRPPEGWEDLEDDREPYDLRNDLAKSLGLRDDIADSKETVWIAGAVCACRPHAHAWEGAPPGLGVALAEAVRKQKEIFNGVLNEAAKHLLGGTETPSRNVELGRLGLRYRREAQGGIGWLR